MTMELSVNNISEKIYTIRGRKILLDSDLSSLYNLKTKALNQAVKRNPKHFPNEAFIFQLTTEEFQNLRQTQNLPSIGQGTHRKYFPHAFTEIGVIVLSGILRTDRARMVNLFVVKAFVQFRSQLETYSDLSKQLHDTNARIDSIIVKYDQKIEALQNKSISITPPKYLSSSNSDLEMFAHKIFDLISHHYGIKVTELRSTIRTPSIALPRQIAMYLVKSQTGASLKEIAKIFRRDHTTILHACKKIEKLLTTDSSLAAAIAAIRMNLLS